MSDPESPSLYEEHQPRFRQIEEGVAQQFYVDSDNQLVAVEDNRNRLSGGGSAASPAVVTAEQYTELQQVVKREESAARLELLELDSFLHNQTQVRFGIVLYRFSNTVETAYKVAICPRGNLLYMRIYLITDLKVLWKGIFGL